MCGDEMDKEHKVSKTDETGLMEKPYRSTEEKIDVKLLKSSNSASPTVRPNFRQALLRPVMLVTILILLASCSSSTSEETAGSNGQDDSLANSNPCELLTAGEVESIFGEAATADTEPTSAGLVRSCSFHNDGGGKFFLIQLGPETALEVDARDPDVTVIKDLGD